MAYLTGALRKPGQQFVGPGADQITLSGEILPHWKGGYGQLEVPQVFEVNGTWYCLFCTADEHFSKAEAAKTRPVTGNHYLIGEGPRGPWRIAPGFLDGEVPCERYAARVLNTDNGMVIIGFADKPNGATEFVGQIMDPSPISVTSDGQLFVTPQQQAAE